VGVVGGMGGGCAFDCLGWGGGEAALACAVEWRGWVMPLVYIVGLRFHTVAMMIMMHEMKQGSRPPRTVLWL
jgi:hypothetical protein